MTPNPTPQESIEELVERLDNFHRDYRHSRTMAGIIFKDSWPRISAELKRLRSELKLRGALKCCCRKYAAVAPGKCSACQTLAEDDERAAK